MTQHSLLRAGRIAACLAYILIAPLATPVLAAPEIVAAPGATVAPAVATPLAGTPLVTATPLTAVPADAVVNLETANPAQPLTAPLYWRLDKTGRVTPEEVLSPAQQSFFTPFPTTEPPKVAGTSWFRLALAPYSGKNGAYYLDLNSRVSGQIPKGQRVWLLREGQPHIQLHTEVAGLYQIPDSPVPATIFVRTEGVPAVGFAPVLRNAATLNVLDTDGPFWIGIVLAIALVFGLLRGIFEQREWRMWAALYAGTLLVTNAWGFPATPDGKVLLLDLPGLLAPGIALLLLPHVGRHILRSREHSTILDVQFILIGLLGLVLCLLPMLSNHVWTIRYLPLWPLGMLLLLPTTVQAMAQKINGAGRFLTICLLPPLGLLGFAPLPAIQFTSAEDAGLWSALLSLLPSLGLCASSLLIALAPTPKHEIKSRRVPAATTGLEMPGKTGGESPLRLEPKPVALTAAPPLVLDDASRMTPPADVDSALPLHNLERRMRGPLDVLLNEIGTLEQMNLPRDLVDHAHRLSRAGRQLSLLIGEISSGRHGSPVVIRQKSGMENAAQAHATPFDLYDVILQAHNAVAELAEAKNLALSWFTAPHLARTYNGQGDRLLRVLTLLAESAVHATDRGIVQIRVQRLPESNDPGMLQFTVSDTGKGAPPLQRSSISLVQVWELVGPTGGTLNVESGPTGTSIAFSMRFQALSAESPARSLHESASSSLRSEMCNALRILVISDVPGSRQLLSYYLDELPHEVREARSVDEALGMYMQAPGALLIFDGDLPEADVVRAIAAIRAFEGEHGYPLSSILALVKDDEQIERLRRAGCTHSLLKPVSRTELRQLALRLAPVPRSRSQHKPETSPAAPKPAAPSASASGNASKSGGTTEKPLQKRKNAWSLLSPLSMERRAEPEVRSDDTKPDTLPPLASSSSVSAPRPVVPAPKTALPELRAPRREATPVDLSRVETTPAETVSPQSTPVPQPTPVSVPLAPQPSVQPTVVSVPLTPPVQPTTAQILDEMVRDAEDKITAQPIPTQPDTRPIEAVEAPETPTDTTPPATAAKAPDWKLKPRQDTVRRAVDAVSAERKPIPWPRSRNTTELSKPYAVGNETEWVSDPRPIGSRERTNDDKERAAIHVTDAANARSAAAQRLTQKQEASSPVASPESPDEEKSAGLVGSLLSVFKKKPPHPAPQVFSSLPHNDEWVSEPRPITRRDDAQAPSPAKPLPRPAEPAPRPSASQADARLADSGEWVGEPRPKIRPVPEEVVSEQATPERVFPEQTAPEQVPPMPSTGQLAQESSGPALRLLEDEPTQSAAPHIDPLAPVDFAEPDIPAHVQKTPASPQPTPAPQATNAGRKVSRKVTFQPLLLPGLEPTPAANEGNAPGNGLELHFSTAPDEPEVIFNLTEIVDDSAELPVLPLDSAPRTQSMPVDFAHSPVQQALGETAQTETPETPESSALLPDESPVEEQLQRLVTLSAQAQEAFATDDVPGVREAAAQLADTATALGLHGLIDLARCLEEVAGDAEATASLLENIEAAVNDEKF